MDGGRVLVPLRALAEALGATVEWVPPQRQVRAYLGEGRYYTIVRVDHAYASSDGWGYRLDVPARIIADRVYVPLRFIAEALGASVQWDPSTRTALVSTVDAPSVSEAEVEQALRDIAPHLERCLVPRADGPEEKVLCLDSQKYWIDVSPAVFRRALWHMQTANLVARQLGPAPEEDYDVQTVEPLVRAVAAPVWQAPAPPPALPKATPAPSAPLVALLVSLLGILSGDTAEPVEVINQAQNWQVRSGYRADSFSACTLKAGTVIYGGHPGQSHWYTDQDTLDRSELDAAVLWRLLQVPPNQTFGGYRPAMQAYQVLKDVVVACGKVGANKVIKTKEGELDNGEGGGNQYFLREIDASVLRPVGDPIALTNWSVSDAAWEVLLVGR